jgi:hypothetical protein
MIDRHPGRDLSAVEQNGHPVREDGLSLVAELPVSRIRQRAAPRPADCRPAGSIGLRPEAQSDGGLGRHAK